jgi:hypothetical protein
MYLYRASKNIFIVRYLLTTFPGTKVHPVP